MFGYISLEDIFHPDGLREERELGGSYRMSQDTNPCYFFLHDFCQVIISFESILGSVDYLQLDSYVDNKFECQCYATVSLLKLSFACFSREMV